MAESELAVQEEKIIDPLAGEELSQEDIDKEVQSRIDAIEFATKEEIIAALRSSNPTATRYLAAFSKKDLPRLTKAEVADLAKESPNTAASAQIKNLNVSARFIRHRLKIESEVTEGNNNVVNRVLCNTRIRITGQSVPPFVVELHQAVREKIPTQNSKKAELLELIIDQYLGIPLVNLSAYLDLEPADISAAIESINEELKSSKVKIHIRNGVAVIGDTNGYITLFDNAETRKNLFPKKKEEAQTETADAKATRLESELGAALAALAAEKEKTTAAETTIAELTRKLSEAEDMALEADEKAGQAESKATNLEAEKQTLTAQVSKLELDIQESLRISAETAQGSGLEELRKGKEKVEAEVKRLEAKLEAKTAELTTSREESRTAREEARVAKSVESTLRKQLEAAKKQAADAEEARGAAMRKAGRGGVDVDSAKDKATIQDLQETIRRGEEQNRSLRIQLQRQNGLATIHPEELARLKRNSTELNGASETIRNLQRQLEAKESPAQPEQKDSSELIQLRAKLAEKDAALIKAQQDLAQSTQQFTVLTNELRETTELLESATSSTPAAKGPEPKVTAVAAPAKTPIPTPKNPTVVIPAQAPKPKPAPIEDPIEQIKKNDFSNSEALINTVNKALTLNAGTNQHGLPKAKLRDIRNALTNLQFGKDSWLHDTRVKIVKALNDMKEKGNGDHIPVEAVEACIRTIDVLPK
ncbi:MAG: hypothetical protein NTZ25_05905 [Candidatus Peregrinibacteria bacterium]|nr:hypothetical protein [Candidatus Peregrinibacteria bacterium]